MFPSLSVLWLCLFVWRISAQEESATPPPAAFDFPVADGLIINTIDTVVLQWTSEFQQAFLQMWCQNGSAGNNVVLGSAFQVNTSGIYPYIISKDAPAIQNFPVACHASLVNAPVNGDGVDTPVGVTFVSLSGEAPAKTFSLNNKAVETVGVTTTVVPALSSTPSSSVTSSNSSPTGSESSSIQSPSSSFTTSTIPAPTPPPTLTPPAVPPVSPKPRLSTGLIVVVSVVSVVVLLSIVALVYWYRRRSVSPASQEPAVPELEGKVDLGPYGAASYGRHELEDEARRRFEMAADMDRPEMEGGTVRYELAVASPKPKVSEMF